MFHHPLIAPTMERVLMKIYLVATLIMFTSLTLSASDNTLTRDINILIISSYNPETTSTANTIDEFVNYYDKHGDKATIMVENMNCKSLTEATTWADRMREIRQRYVGNLKPDITILLGQEAWAAYLSLNPNELDRSIPVICGKASRNVVRMPNETHDITNWMPTSIDCSLLNLRYNIVGGVLYEYNIEKNLEIIEKLYPETKNIALLTDNSYGGLSLLAHVNDCMIRHPEFNFISLDGRKETIYSMSEAIQCLPENTVLLLGSWRVDKTESYYIRNSTHLLKDSNKEIPVFTLSSVGLGYWAIGGYLPKYSSQGEELAQKAIKYLRGKRDGKEQLDDITIANCEYVFDENELTSRNISRSNIPADIRLLNEKKSVLNEYSNAIIIIGLIFTILVAILSVFITLWTRARRLRNQLLQSHSELIAAKDKAEESNRMKTAFLANMSHEIRTPLNAIVGFSDVLITDNSLSDEEKVQIGGLISKNSTLLLNLINDILDMSRLESGRTKYIVSEYDMVALCNEVLSTCKTASHSSLEYIFETDLEECRCMIDKQHIRQVIINLISNSNKFTKEGSITLRLEMEGNNIKVSVTDTGIGIPEDKRNKVFERFEKLSELSQGFGIGLSLCKNIITHFGGDIWVDPEYKGGARMVFVLPFVPVTKE